MNKSNILEVTNLSDLKLIMESHVTVILGFTTPNVKNDLKIVVRKFLKRKSEKFPLITFVYMEVSDKDRNTLNILRGDTKDYPKVYHIRGGNNILVAVQEADEEKLNESFAAAEPYYIKEMKDFQKNTQDEDTPISEKHDDMSLSNDDNKSDNLVQEEKTVESNNVNPNLEDDVKNQELEKKKNLEKLVFLNKMKDDMNIKIIKDVAKRKKIESMIEKKSENNDDDCKEYRKNLRKNK